VIDLVLAIAFVFDYLFILVSFRYRLILSSDMSGFVISNSIKRLSLTVYRFSIPSRYSALMYYLI